MLKRILKKNKYLEIEIGAKCGALSDNDYGSNYDEILKKNGPKLDGQIPLINKFHIYLDSKLLSEIDYRNKINKLF